MATLKEISQDILDEKTLKIIPENIRKGITIFDITGTLEEGSTSRRIKLFADSTSMQADPDPQEDDLALVYNNESGLAEPDLVTDTINFPSSVTLSQAISDSINVDIRPADTEASMDWMVMCYISNYSMDFELSNYSEGTRINVSYDTMDGMNFTLRSIQDENYNPIDNPVSLPISIKFPSDLTEDAASFFQIGILTYEGLYEYKSNEWVKASTQIDVDNTKLYYEYTVYGPNGYMNNGRIGSSPSTITFNLPTNEFIQRVNIISELYTPWELDASITDLSSLIPGTYSMNDFPKANLSRVTNMSKFFMPSDYYEYFPGFEVDSGYTNFAESLPLAENLTSPLLLDTGISPENFPQEALNILANKGYKDTITPDTTNWSTEYKIIINGSNTQTVSKSYNSSGEYDRYGSTIKSYIDDKCNNSRVAVKDTGTEGSLLYMISLLESDRYIRTVDFSNAKTENVLSTKSLFNYCQNLNNVPSFNTSNVIDMSKMFMECNNLINIPNLNTINVTNMSKMFMGCNKMNTVPIYDMSNVVDASYMFNGCNNLTSIPSFNLHSLKNGSYMFNYCPNITSTGSLTIDNAENLSYMFGNLTKITSLQNITITNAKNISRLCNNCCNLNTSPNLDTTLTENLQELFYNCVRLHDAPMLNFNSTNSIAGLFMRCNNLVNVPNYDTTNITNFSNLFSYCYVLQNIPNLDTSNAKDLSYMYSCCWSMKAVPDGLNTVNATNIQGLFSSCQCLKNIPDLDISKTNSISHLFSACHNLLSAPMLNTENIVDASGLFSFCGSLNTAPEYDFSNCENFNYTFQNCLMFNDLSGYNINTSKGKDFSDMFYCCANLRKAPNLDTSNAILMNSMFGWDKNLVEVPEYDVSNVINMDQIFLGCNNLSDAAIQNIINMCLNCTINNSVFKNLHNANHDGIWGDSTIANTRYQNRWAELTNAGWTY